MVLGNFEVIEIEIERKLQLIVPPEAICLNDAIVEMHDFAGSGARSVVGLTSIVTA